jgi:PKD repeat protein
MVINNASAPPLNVTFSSAGSLDLDRSIASYLWNFGDGATSASANPQHTYTVRGNYVATLTVTDNLGASTSNTVAIEVTAPNQNPVAKFIVTPPACLANAPRVRELRFSSNQKTRKSKL